MITTLVTLPILDSIEEDFLRYTFESWEKPLKLNLAHPIGQSIYSKIHKSYRKHRYSEGTKILKVQVPEHKNINLKNYPYLYISVEDAHRIKMEVFAAYFIEVTRIVALARYRGINLYQSITFWLDTLNAASGDYELSLNYEQIRKMITRHDKKVEEMLKEYNQGSKYQALI